MSKDDTTQTVQDNASGDSALIEKLKKHKAANAGINETKLPDTGITASWPKFKPHHVWMKAQRLSKKNPHAVMDNYLPLTCKFDGEKMTLEEFKSLIPTDDVLHLTGEIMGDDDEEGNEGNVLH